MANEFIARNGLIAKSNSSVYGDLNTYGNILISGSNNPTLALYDSSTLSGTESPRIKLYGNSGSWFWIDNTANTLRFSNGTLPGSNPMLLQSNGDVSVTGAVTGRNLSGTNTGDQDLSNLTTYTYVNNAFVPTGRTVSAGSGLSGGGNLGANVTISHADTSSASSLTTTNSSFNVIQNATIAIDTYGHVTSTSSSNINLDDYFVKVAGDTMTGDLYVNSATNSTSTSTGAIHTAGGIGVVGNAWIGGNTTFYNDVNFTNIPTGFRSITWLCGDNDYGRIGCGAASTNAGYLEIATADDGTEPIYIRQYTGVFSSLVRTATLLDGSGNTSFPGALGANRVYSGYDSGQVSSFSCSNWFRSNGTTGWYNETYGAGIYSDESNVVSTYLTNRFKVYNTGTMSIQTAGGILAAGNIQTTGTVTGINLQGSNTGDQDLSNLATYSYVNSTFVDVAGDVMSGNLTINNTLSVLTSTITSKTAGTSTLYNLAISNNNCMIIDYTVYNNDKTALRSGTVTCNFTASAITYKEDSTPDLGTSTTAVKFVPIISGSNVAFQTIITGSDTWNFKISIKYF